VSIATLPGYVLLEIFSFYVAAAYHEDEWHTLVHVCQKWRSVAFASPHRLGLRLLCSEGRLAKKTLEVWPALPIIVKGYYAENLQLEHVNVMDMLKYKDRIREVNIQFVPGPLMEGIAAIKVPLPALTSLTLQSKDESAPALPDSFFGGSAQLLQELSLDGIPSPAVRNLLVSTKVLVSLRLWNIPPSGYISPEEMANSLSELTNLKILVLGFRSPRPQTDTETESRRSPLLSRIVLPALTMFHFKGNVEYLDDFVVQIDVPQLDNIALTLFNQLIFDTSQLRCFLGRTERFNVAHRADVVFFGYRVQVSLFRQNGTDYHKMLELGISCATTDWQLSSLAQLCTLSLPPLPALERLGIHEGRSSQPQWQDDVEDRQWAELFRPFTTVTTLDISETFVGRVAPALKALARRESATEVMPALENIFLEGQQPPQSIYNAIGQFVAVRELCGQPVAIHHRERGRYWHMRDEVY
jgi:hypothetical protein